MANQKPTQQYRSPGAGGRPRRQSRRPLVIMAFLGIAIMAVCIFYYRAAAGGAGAQNSGEGSTATGGSGTSENSFAGISESGEGSGGSEDSGGSSGSGGSTSSEIPVASIDKTAWNLALVNMQNPMEEKDIPLGTLSNGIQFDARAIEALEAMLAAGNSEGLQLMVCSGYRSVAYQTTLFNKKVQEYINKGYSEQAAYDIAKTIVAPPGTSEHNTGLAADIVAVNYQILDEGFAATPEFAWLQEHAKEYGFILRFPKGKEDITGIIYEPWHYRYVGIEAAEQIWSSGVCLEEYLA